MSVLMKGQLCVIVKGCPPNLGLIVRIVEHLGQIADYIDAYEIEPISDRPMHVWVDKARTRTEIWPFKEGIITDRDKLRPLPDLPAEDNTEIFELPSDYIQDQVV